MAKTRAERRRSKNTAPAKGGLTDALKQRWQKFQEGKSPILIFLFKFLAVLVPFYIIWNLDIFKEYPLRYWNTMNAHIAAGILNIFGSEVTANGIEIVGPSAAVMIKEGCDGIEPTMLLIAGVLSFPSSWHLKLKGVFWGGLAILAINFVRILSLYVVQRHWPAGFEFMHIEFWQVFFIMLAVFIWILWIRKTGLHLPSPAKHETATA